MVGGLAVSVRGEPRTTRDIDIAVAVENDVDAESLVRELQVRGYEAGAVVEQNETKRLATVRTFTPSRPQIVVDLLFASSGIEPEIVSAAEITEILPGLRVPVALTGHLLALKVLARDDRRRPQDWDDIHALLRESDAAELARARTALQLIAERGYRRGKDLLADLETMLRER